MRRHLERILEREEDSAGRAGMGGAAGLACATPPGEQAGI